MKNLIMLPFLLLITAVNAFALEDGLYLNKTYNSNMPSMFKSLDIQTQSCKNGGAIVSFNDSTPINFCVGFQSEITTKYRKCNGFKRYEVPFRTCYGFKVDAEEIETVKVVKKQNGIIELLKTNFDEGEKVYQESYWIREASASTIILTFSFSDFQHHRTGLNTYTFTKD